MRKINPDLSKEDKDWINKHMEEQFPRFQFSFFPHGKEGEQLVVRGSDFSQFTADIELVRKQFGQVIVAQPVTSANTSSAIPTVAEICPVCGSSTILTETKTGKKLEKCSTSGWDSVNKVPTGCSFVKWL